MARRLDTHHLTETPQDLRDSAPAGSVRIHNVSDANRVVRLHQADRLRMPGNYGAATSANSVGEVDTVTNTTDTSKDMWFREEDVPRARELIVPGRSVRMRTSQANGASFTVSAVNEDDQTGGVEFECTIGSIDIDGTGVANNQNLTIFDVAIMAQDTEGLTIPALSYVDVTHASNTALMLWCVNGDGMVQIGYDG